MNEQTDWAEVIWIGGLMLVALVLASIPIIALLTRSGC